MTEPISGDEPPGERFVRAPNRKKYEEDLEVLNSAIRCKEDELKSLELCSDERIQSELRQLHGDRGTKSQRRQSVDSDLRKINEDIRKEEAELTKLQSNLRYRSEHRIDETIQRLEMQLKTNNFRVSEERKLVAEIDALKRSQKDLTAYLALKKQIDEKRDQQRRMREERDRLHKLVTEVKQKEECIRHETFLKRDKEKQIKADIAELQKKVKVIHFEFNAQDREYRHQREEQRKRQATSIQRRKEEARRAEEEAYKQELEEFEATRELFCDEKQLCKTLIKYLKKHLITGDDVDRTTNETANTFHDSMNEKSLKQLNVDKLNQSLGSEGMFMLRRKADENEIYSSKGSRKGKKEKKKLPLKKPIVHTPEIFDQFSKLQLSAPSSSAEIAFAIEKLEEKLAYYMKGAKDSLKLHITASLPPPTETTLDDCLASAVKESVTSSAASYTGSAVSGSMPTTPDVQMDSFSSRLLQIGSSSSNHCQRRMSSDSGTGDVEVLDQNVNDEDYSTSRPKDLCLLNQFLVGYGPSESGDGNPPFPAALVSPSLTITESSSPSSDPAAMNLPNDCEVAAVAM